MKYLITSMSIFCMFSCGTKVFKYEKTDYLINGNEKYIQVQYNF